jgi:hypothetical protein
MAKMKHTAEMKEILKAMEKCDVEAEFFMAGESELRLQPINNSMRVDQSKSLPADVSEALKRYGLDLILASVAVTGGKTEGLRKALNDALKSVQVNLADTVIRNIDKSK